VSNRLKKTFYRSQYKKSTYLTGAGASADDEVGTCEAYGDHLKAAHIAFFGLTVDGN
jgi:hypothetical protein